MPWHREYGLPPVSDRIDVVVIGAGSAGLAVSRELSRVGIAHVVLEKGKIGQSWRDRWESFCLVTPNWSVQLPDHPYEGPDPDGFMLRDEVTDYLGRYAIAVEAPISEGVEVTRLARSSSGEFRLQSSAGEFAARNAVVSTGAYQRSYRPPAASTLPASLPQIGIDDYRSPAELPPGPVLVVGSGQSGCQVAEELHESGREVFLGCGKAPWAPRRIGDHDLVWWLLHTGFLDEPSSSLQAPAARLAANVLTSGRNGGHDLHLRTLQRSGVTLVGRFLGAEGSHARFAPDLAGSVAWGDQRHAQLMQRVLKLTAERGLPAPVVAEPGPLSATARDRLDLRGFGAVLFAGGFRPNYERWIDCPGAFDEFGFPVHEDGQSVVAPGLYFVGVHFLRKRKSSLLMGVGEDAAVVAGKIASGGAR
jgi:putative flavoprotein involved in K+ transport